MAAKKLKKSPAKQKRSSRKGVATRETLKEKIGKIQAQVSQLEAVVAAWPEDLASFEVDGWQRFTRASEELRLFIKAVENHMNLAKE
jgi:hypothetical protein